MKKICAITGTRADYGLFYWLLKELEADNSFDLQLIVTGSHLSEEHGYTYSVIEEDGFKISHKANMHLSLDQPVDITSSMGIGISEIGKAFKKLDPDLVIVIGDRYEILISVIAATIFNIPIAHIHGGERSEGAFDEAFRHSITKMSHFHFCALEEYKKRIIQLGEDPEKVFNVGAIGLDNIKQLRLLTKSKLEEEIKFKFNKRNLLITFHPTTLEKSTAKEQFTHLLDALTELKETNLIFTKSNADPGGLVINNLVDEFVKKNFFHAKSFSSMGQLRYLSAVNQVDAVIGNSSSGIIEAPSLKVGTLNIGDRQKGRVKSKSVLDCEPTKVSIQNGLKKLYEKDFVSKLDKVVNPYGNGGTSKKIVKLIKSFDFDKDRILKKSFFDIGFTL